MSLSLYFSVNLPAANLPVAFRALKEFWTHLEYGALELSHHLPGVNLPVVSDQGSRLVASACPSFSRPRVVDLPVASVLRIAFSCPLMSQLFPSSCF